MTIGTEPQIDVAPAAHRLHRKGFEHRSGTQNVRERVSSLIALAVRGLAELYQPEDQYFPHTMRGCAELTGPQLRPEATTCVTPRSSRWASLGYPP
jgi:hypothetical protein